MRVSEFNSTPVTCTMTGSAAPGTVKDRLLKHTLTRSGSGRKSQGATLATMEDLDGTRALQIASLGWSTNLGGGNAKGGEQGVGFGTFLFFDPFRETTVTSWCIRTNQDSDERDTHKPSSFQCHTFDVLLAFQ